MPSIRQARVGEMIKRELAEIFQREMRDPRLALVSVTDVDVARDFSIAKVYISVIGDAEDKAAALKALHGAAGYLRGQLGSRIELRSVPSLSFRYDTGIERGFRMYELLKQEEAEVSANTGISEEEDGDNDDREEGEALTESSVANSSESEPAGNG